MSEQTLSNLPQFEEQDIATLRTIIERYGYEAQLEKLFEELLELATELQKRKKNNGKNINEINIMGEIADVFVVCSGIILHHHLIFEIAVLKIRRQQKRMDDEVGNE